MPFGWAAAATAVATVASSQIQADAAEDAAHMQWESGQESMRREDAALRHQEAMQKPFRDIALKALPGLEEGMLEPERYKAFTMADYEQSPNYLFNLAEGEKAVNRAAAARGSYLSPATVKALQRFGSNLASNEFQNSFNNYQTTQSNKLADQSTRLNRLQQVAGFGQVANAQLGQAYQNNAAQVGNTLQGVGNAQAASKLSQGNSYGNALNSLANQGVNAYNGYQANQAASNAAYTNNLQTAASQYAWD